MLNHIPDKLHQEQDILDPWYNDKTYLSHDVDQTF